MMALLLVCGLPLAAFADTYDIANGSIEISASEDKQTVSQNGNTVDDDAPVITGTTTKNTLTIKAEENATANVTLSGVNINVGETGDEEHRVTGEAAVRITGEGDVTIELDGENTVQGGYFRAGVEKNDADSSGKLTITDENGTDGSLKATGGVYGSGIGGGNDGSGSDITITGSAEVTANGGMDAAGIGGGAGGGAGGSGSNITITGNAEVTAQGNDGGAGIGGGAYGSGSNITISGSAEVTAKGDITGAGIGGGYNYIGKGTGSNITVSGDAQVKAQGGKGYYNGYATFGAGAAIGDGGHEEEGNNPVAAKGEDAVVTTEAPKDGESYGLYVGELNKGWVATYTPGTHDLDNATPNSLTYKDDNGNLTTSSNDQPIVKLEPTCTEDGHRAGFMIGNTQVGGETLKATGHSMGDYTVFKAATCTEAGEERAYCKNNCGHYETKDILPQGHSFTKYISDGNATYASDGTKTAKCDHCDATDTLPDPGSKLVFLPGAFYKVIGKDGKALVCKETNQNGVLTITAEEDYATLTGSLSGMKTLKAHGIDTIVFVTKGATSTFAVDDLLAQGASGDTYQLTHDGSTVTFTLGDGTDISKILK